MAPTQVGPSICQASHWRTPLKKRRKNSVLQACLAFRRRTEALVSELGDRNTRQILTQVLRLVACISAATISGNQMETAVRSTRGKGGGGSKERQALLTHPPDSAGAQPVVKRKLFANRRFASSSAKRKNDSRNIKGSPPGSFSSERLALLEQWRSKSRPLGLVTSLAKSVKSRRVAATLLYRPYRST